MYLQSETLLSSAATLGCLSFGMYGGHDKGHRCFPLRSIWQNLAALQFVTAAAPVLCLLVQSYQSVDCQQCEQKAAILSMRRFTTQQSAAKIHSIQLLWPCLTVYDTSADAVADSYFQLGGNFLTRCTQAFNESSSMC